MKDHEQPGFSFTDDMTPKEMLDRLKTFAMYGLDKCPEVDELVEKLETQLELLEITQESCNHWQQEYFAIADMSQTDPGEEFTE